GVDEIEPIVAKVPGLRVGHPVVLLPQRLHSIRLEKAESNPAGAPCHPGGHPGRVPAQTRTHAGSTSPQREIIEKSWNSHRTSCRLAAYISLQHSAEAGHPPERRHAMAPSPAQGPPCPSEQAFVVQCRAEAALTQGRCDGRVEHVVSGHAALLTRWAEL